MTEPILEQTFVEKHRDAPNVRLKTPEERITLLEARMAAMEVMLHEVVHRMYEQACHPLAKIEPNPAPIFEGFPRDGD